MMQNRATLSQNDKSLSCGPLKAPDHLQFMTPVKTSGNQPPLVCIYPGPPGSFEFADMLPQDQPVYDLYFSKLSSDAVFPTVEELAQDFIRDLRKIQPHGPYQLCGYSNAGIVAYEMARALVDYGEVVPLLVLVDTWHPQFVRNMPLWQRAIYRGMRFLDRLKKYKALLHHGKLHDFSNSFGRFAAKRVKMIGWRIFRTFQLRENQPAPTSFKVIEANSRMETYAPGMYGGRLMLIRPNDSVDRQLSDLTVGWHVCTSSEIDVQFVSAPHGDMMNRPYVSTVLAKVVPNLLGAEPTEQSPSLTNSPPSKENSYTERADSRTQFQVLCSVVFMRKNRPE